MLIKLSFTSKNINYPYKKQLMEMPSLVENSSRSQGENAVSIQANDRYCVAKNIQAKKLTVPQPMRRFCKHPKNGPWFTRYTGYEITESQRCKEKNQKWEENLTKAGFFSPLLLICAVAMSKLEIPLSAASCNLEKQQILDVKQKQALGAL